MKRIVYLLYTVGLLLFAAACTDDWEQKSGVVSGNEMQLSFHTVIPDPEEVSTRSIDADGWGIQTLWLFNFDAEGTFLGRSQATLTGGDVIDAQRTFTATVSSRTRIVHLLANQNLDGVFDDNANLGAHENAVMTSLVSTSGRLIYWGRVDLTSATDATNFKTQFEALTIPMYRNQAWISHTLDSGVSGFEVTGSAVCNVYVNGTSIPFNSNTNTFDWPEVWTTSPYVTTPIDHTKVADVGVDTEENKYVFETSNTGEDEIYLIYEIQKDGEPTPRYYKVAMVDENKDPLPIYRNYHYIVHFTDTPSGNGSASFEEAQEAAPINNTWVSVDASIPSIGNDTEGRLTIEGETTVIYTTGGLKELHYTYTGYKEVTVTWLSDDGVAASDVLTHVRDGQNGTISFTANAMAEGQVCRGTIQVKAGPLVRYINIVTVRTFSFEPVWCSWGVYNGEAGQDVGLTFTIPDTYPTELFPLRCLISTDKLSGSGVVPLDVIYPTNEDGTPNEEYGEVVDDIGYKYVYMADEPGMQIIYFQTNYPTSETSGTIRIEADYFETLDKEYTLTSRNNGQLVIANAEEYTPDEYGGSAGTIVYYNLVPQKEGSEVTFELRSEGNQWQGPQNLPEGVQVAIFTSNLKPAEGTEGDYEQGVSQVGSGNYYLYTTKGNGDDLRFVTTKANSAEAVRFSTIGQGNTTDYKSCMVQLGNYREWEFDLQMPASVDYGIGTPVDISFQIAPFTSDPVGDVTSTQVDPGDNFYVYLTTKNLEPTATENRLEPTADGYRYLVKEADIQNGRVTLHFQTSRIVSAETVSIRSDESIAFTPMQATFTNNLLAGGISYGTSGQTLPDDAFVTLERKDGTRIGVVTVTNGDAYTIRLRGEYNFGWEEELFMKSNIDGRTYSSPGVTLAQLAGENVHIQLQ